MHRLIVVLFLILLPSTLPAQTLRGGEAIFDALRMEELLRIVQREAGDAGEELAEGMVPETAMRRWRATLDRINDPARLQPAMMENFAEGLPPEQVEPILDFLTGPEGERIVNLELSAREALRDTDIEAMSTQDYYQKLEAEDPRLDLIARFIEVNDLIDANVVGALNANAAFLQGMRRGGNGTVLTQRSDDEIAAEVVAQEPQIRASTREWIFSFLLLAYGPLSDAELRTYIAFSESAAGQALNQALVSAFDGLFVMTSHETGEALAQLLMAEDI